MSLLQQLVSHITDPDGHVTALGGSAGVGALVWLFRTKLGRESFIRAAATVLDLVPNLINAFYLNWKQPIEKVKARHGWPTDDSDAPPPRDSSSPPVPNGADGMH